MKRLLPFIVLILLLLGAFISIPILLKPEVQKARVASQLTALLKNPVVIGNLSFGYFPPALQLEKIVVTNKMGEAYIQADKVTAPLDLMNLLRLKVTPAQINLSGWKAYVSRKADGGWDYRDWWPGETGFSSAKSWTLNRVYWERGEIHWVDAFAPTPAEITLSLVEGSWNPRPEMLSARGSFAAPLTGATVTLSAKGQFFNQPRWTGDLEFAEQGNAIVAHITQTAEGLEMRGQSNRWRLGSAATVTQFFARIPRGPTDAGVQMIENWQFHAKETGGKVSFEQTAAVSGGQTEAKGTLTHQPDGVAMHLEGAVSAIPAEAILAISGLDLPLAGRVTGISKSIEVVLSSQTSSTLSGQGYTEIADGRYQFPDSSIQKLSKAKTTQYIKKKYPDLATTGFPFSKLSAHWDIKKGRVNIDNASFVSSTLKAGWVGSLDIPRKGMDGYVRIDFHEKDPALKATLPAKYATQPAYGRLQGGWQEWFLKAIPASKVPVATRTKLNRVAAQK